MGGSILIAGCTVDSTPLLPEIAADGVFPMAGCSGALVTIIDQADDTPAGWEGGDGGSSFVWAVDCGRVRIGPFERPLGWALAGSDAGPAPDACSADSPLVGRWLAVTDPDVAAYMTEHWGMSVEVAELHYGLAGGQISELQIGAGGSTIFAGSLVDHGMKGSQSLGDFQVFFPGQPTLQLNVTLGMSGTTGLGLPFVGTTALPIAAGLGGQAVGQAIDLSEGDARWEVTHYASVACD